MSPTPTPFWNTIAPNCVKDGVATIACVPALFSTVVTAALTFGGLTAVIFIIVAGIKFMTSGGEAKQVEGAQKTLTYAIVGLVVVLLAFLIINILGYVTNTSCISQFGFENCK